MILIRLSLTAALIYAAVWLEPPVSKIALTVLFVLLALTAEVAGFKIANLTAVLAETVGAAAARIQARRAHRRWHGDR